MQKRNIEKLFKNLTKTAGILILLIILGVVLFLIYQSIPAFLASPNIMHNKNNFFTYVFPLIAGTLISSVIALTLAIPIAIGIALFISHYVSDKLSKPMSYIIDLLAAIPSVIYGLWGWIVLAPKMEPLFNFLSQKLFFIAVFQGPPSSTGRTLFTASIVLSVMILPIIISVVREIFLQTPKLQEEAALALGATKWEMICTAVLPFSKGGIICGAMLGLGRALGETMAVAMVLSPGRFVKSLVQPGNNTISAEIALNFPEASGIRMNALIASGLILFIITFLINMFARWSMSRSSKT